MYVHDRGEEEFIISKTNIISIKPFVIDTNSELEISFAEILITSTEYQIVEFDGSHCKDYPPADNSVTYFEGFKDCVRDALHSYYSTNLNCSVAGFIDDFKNVKPLCNTYDSAVESFTTMKNFNTALSQNPDRYGCTKPCRTSSFKA